MGQRNRRNPRRNNRDENEAINEVISKINKLEKLCDLTEKDFADEGGYADIVAKNSKKLKTNQLRKFFAAVKVIEQKDNLSWKLIEPEFYLLKPRLAVSVGRENIPQPFYKLMMAIMRKVDIGSEEEKLKSFNKFIKFFEAIVAYHKFYYPKSK